MSAAFIINDITITTKKTILCFWAGFFQIFGLRKQLENPIKEERARNHKNAAPTHQALTNSLYLLSELKPTTDRKRAYIRGHSNSTFGYIVQFHPLSYLVKRPQQGFESLYRPCRPMHRAPTTQMLSVQIQIYIPYILLNVGLIFIKSKNPL